MAMFLPGLVTSEYYLPKDVIEFYQFCYVDSTGQVRGASTPFCFKNTEEQSTEGCPDDTDLLVITTQVLNTESGKEINVFFFFPENKHSSLQTSCVFSCTIGTGGTE